jgi:glucosyl-dolichyl phosphate glucuronosyltransferase
VEERGNIPVRARPCNLLRYHATFSVAICTLNRAHLLEQAVASVCQQDYPKDQYELIIVDNGSTDETPLLIDQLAARAPVPVRSIREPRPGASIARNRAAAEATMTYVAYLDDDAVAHSNWLSQLNAAITRHGAMVVGGRIVERYEQHFKVPAWLNCRYLHGFFRLDYEDRREAYPMFPIHFPDYLGAGNCAYARELFGRFGGFPTELGPSGVKPLVAEETYFNVLLERHQVPIYYNDDAVVRHFVSAAQVTKRHMLRKSYYLGISDAKMSIMLDGTRATIAKWKGNIKEIRRFAVSILRDPRNPQTFCRVCRIVYNTSVLWGTAELAMRQMVFKIRGSSEASWPGAR